MRDGAAVLSPVNPARHARPSGCAWLRAATRWPSARVWPALRATALRNAWSGRRKGRFVL